jgi:hypothetical protein
MDTEGGRSRIWPSELAGFDARRLGGQAGPLWARSVPGTVTAVSFNVLPVGWVGEWHESPRAQWVVPLSGRWFIETADGTRVEMGPGDIHWGQDQGTSGERGHRSGQVGADPCVLLFIQYGEVPPELVEDLRMGSSG